MPDVCWRRSGRSEREARVRAEFAPHPTAPAPCFEIRRKDLEYVEQHEEAIARQPAEEFEKAISNLRAKGQKKDGRGRKPKYTELGGCRVRLSDDGTRITIEGLSRKKQAGLLEILKVALVRREE